VAHGAYGAQERCMQGEDLEDLDVDLRTILKNVLKKWVPRHGLD